MVMIGPGPSGAGIGGQHQQRDIGVLVDDVEDLLGRIALADHPFRGDRGDAIGAAGGAIERGIGILMRLGAHDVGDPSHCWFWSSVSMMRSITTPPPARIAQRLA